MADDRASSAECRSAIAADVAGRHSGGVGCADQRADACAHDHGGLHARLVEGFQNSDVGETASAAAAQRKPDRRAHEPPAACDGLKPMSLRQKPPGQWILPTPA